MRSGTDGAAATRARDALALGDWQSASDLLKTERAERGLSRAELSLLAQAAYGAGELEAAITAHEQLHQEHLADGGMVGAAEAAMTVAMHLLIDTGLMAPVRGWLARAERLLDGHEQSAVHASIAMIRTYERLFCGDTAGARRWAEQSIELGAQHRVPAPVAVGRVALARLMILEGRVSDGLQALDEAATVTVSGELDPIATGIVYCELICAMQGLAQYDRAEQWTEVMEAWRRDNAVGGFHGRCRVHRAEILLLRGSLGDAEAEALRACEELRPWLRREFGWPLAVLGAIRLRRGDLLGAEEALLASHELGWDPQPALALLRLAQGETALADELIRDALDHPRNVPSKERPPSGPLRRAPLLAAQVEIAVAAGDIAAATEAADELDGIARTYESAALTASAALAHGRVALARGQPDAAMHWCDRSLSGWSQVGAPYETAEVRMVLARAALARGKPERARLEQQAALSAFERVGAEGAARAAAADPDGSPSNTDGGARRQDRGSEVSLFRRDGDIRIVVFAGRRVQFRDLKGMRHLERLLAEPGREFHVLDLVGMESGGTADRQHGDRSHAGSDDQLSGSHDDDAGPALDEQAKQAYRRRLVEIEEDLDEAARNNDPERAALAEADREYLVRELSRAYGLGGQPRRVGATSERARASVTRALRYTLARIREHHEELADHLDHAVQTGTYCRYHPDPLTPRRWESGPDGAGRTSRDGED